MRTACLQWLALGGFVLGAAACTEEAAPEPGFDLPPGWVTTTVQQPQAVLDVFAADVDGWAAFHRGDLAAARGTSDPALAARVDQELHATRAALVDLMRAVAPELAQRWAAADRVPEGSALHTWAALVAADYDQDPTPLLALGPAPAQPEWTRVHGALGSDLPEEGRLAIVAERAAGAVGDCLRAHMAVRSGSAPLESLAPACPSPLLVEAEGARTLPDPLRLRTAQLHAGPPTATGDGLAGIVFSAAWGTSDTRSAPGEGPTASLLGLQSARSPAEALERVQSLTRTLDTWRPGPDAPGTRLAADLDAFAVYRTRLVESWVRTSNLPALAAAEALRASRDADAGRTVGPTRPPSLLALEARVAVETGHYRAALEPLQALAPLAHVFPELPALTELVNDLQVAATLGRSGDSKEP